MYTRQMERADLWDCAKILNSNMNDEVWSRCFAHRDKYPMAYMRTGLDFVSGIWRMHDSMGFVAVADESDFEPGAKLAGSSSVGGIKAGDILGMALWGRMNDPSYRNEKQGVFWSVERGLQQVQELYKKWLMPNASVDHAVQRQIISKFVDIIDNAPFNKLVPTPHWHLGLLFVAPQAHGMGVGGMLMQWGLDRAREEPTADQQMLSLVASPHGRWLYEKVGMRQFGTLDGGSSAIRIPDCRPRSSMIWDPTGHWTMPRDGRGPDLPPAEKALGYKDYVLFRPERLVAAAAAAAKDGSTAGVKDTQAAAVVAPVAT